jgi:hypothetical protein
MIALDDDRDDRDDRPTVSYYDGDHCEHRVYVGGCGIDWMCSWCEDGISASEAKRIVRAEQTRATRERAERAAKLLALLLMHGMRGTDAQKFAQETSYIGNPRSRYGRH